MGFIQATIRWANVESVGVNHEAELKNFNFWTY